MKTTMNLKKTLRYTAATLLLFASVGLPYAAGQTAKKNEDNTKNSGLVFGRVKFTSDVPLNSPLRGTVIVEESKDNSVIKTHTTQCDTAGYYSLQNVSSASEYRLIRVDAFQAKQKVGDIAIEMIRLPSLPILCVGNTIVNASANQVTYTHKVFPTLDNEITNHFLESKTHKSWHKQIAAEKKKTEVQSAWQDECNRRNGKSGGEEPTKMDERKPEVIPLILDDRGNNRYADAILVLRVDIINGGGAGGKWVLKEAEKVGACGLGQPVKGDKKAAIEIEFSSLSLAEVDKGRLLFPLKDGVLTLKWKAGKSPNADAKVTIPFDGSLAESTTLLPKSKEYPMGALQMTTVTAKLPISFYMQLDNGALSSLGFTRTAN